MRNLILSVGLISVLTFAANAQTFAEDLEKIKQIRLLVDTQADVSTLLAPDTGFVWRNRYSRLNSHLTVYFSEGQCSNEREGIVSENDWEVPEGKAVMVMLTPKSEILLADLGINYSTFRRVKVAHPGPFGPDLTFVDKKKGIAISSSGEILNSVFLFPSAASNPLLCRQKEVQDYYASKRWVRRSKKLPAINYKDILYNKPTTVVALDLDITDFSIHRKIKVETTIINPENDPITYMYALSGGKIIGEGSKVVWDLSGVAPGTYSIIAGADDGDGTAGKYIKRTFVVD